MCLLVNYLIRQHHIGDAQTTNYLLATSTTLLVSVPRSLESPTSTNLENFSTSAGSKHGDLSLPHRSNFMVSQGCRRVRSSPARTSSRGYMEDDNILWLVYWNISLCSPPLSSLPRQSCLVRSNLVCVFARGSQVTATLSSKQNSSLGTKGFSIVPFAASLKHRRPTPN